MNPITDYLVQRSNGLLSTKEEVNNWTGKNYKMFNTGSVEVDTAEFLYAWIRVLKPKRILDTGTHFGVSALYMALASQHNNLGQVLTMEIDDFYLKVAKELWRNCGVTEKIDTWNGKSMEYPHKEEFDFMLLDTEPNIRFAELVHYFPYLTEGGYVFLHDLHRHMGQGQPRNPDHPEIANWPWGTLPQEVVQWVREDKLRPFHLPTPRGLMGLYKPTKEDYKW